MQYCNILQAEDDNLKALVPRSQRLTWQIRIPQAILDLAGSAIGASRLMKSMSIKLTSPTCHMTPKRRDTRRWRRWRKSCARDLQSQRHPEGCCTFSSSRANAGESLGTETRTASREVTQWFPKVNTEHLPRREECHWWTACTNHVIMPPCHHTSWRFLINEDEDDEKEDSMLWQS